MNSTEEKLLHSSKKSDRASTQKSGRLSRQIKEEVRRSHLYEETDSQDIRHLKMMIFQYKFLYLFAGFYTSMIVFILPVFMKYLEQRDIKDTSNIRLLLLSSWTIKPLFGFISDKFYPYRYRIKSHILIMLFLNIVLSILIVLGISFLKQDDTQLNTVIVMNVMLFVSMAYIDSICRKLELSRGTHIDHAKVRGTPFSEARTQRNRQCETVSGQKLY